MVKGEQRFKPRGALGHHRADTLGQGKEVTDQRYSANQSGKTITVNGRVRSNVTPHLAIVADESDARPGEYWTKHYVGTISRDGSYSVTITEPAVADGTLKTWFVFENGATTGNGRKRGKAGAVARPYRHVGNTYHFD